MSGDETPKPPVVKSGWQRALYLLFASLFFILGVAGIFLPGLPGTPFLLLTSYFLLRSFPRLNDKLLDSRLIGPVLRDWQEKQGVKRGVKVWAVCVVVAAVAFSIWWSGYSTVFTVAIVLLASIGIAVICWLPVVR